MPLTLLQPFSKKADLISDRSSRFSLNRQIANPDNAYANTITIPARNHYCDVINLIWRNIIDLEKYVTATPLKTESVLLSPSYSRRE